MKQDRSFDNVSFATLGIYALVFIAVCGVLILFLLLPLLKDHNLLASQLASQNLVYQKARSILSQNQERLDVLISENNKTLTQFDTSFNEAHFKDFAQKFIEISSLKEQNLTTNEPFVVKRFKLLGKIQSPKAFYDFVEGLNDYENIVKIDYPLFLKASGGAVNIELFVKVYSSKN